MNLQICTIKNTLMEKCLEELTTLYDTRNQEFAKYQKIINEREPTEAENLLVASFGYQYNIYALADIMLSGFVIHNGCYLTEYAIHEGVIPIPEPELIPGRYYDRTDYETSGNHIHTMDLLMDDHNDIFQLMTGMIVADHWRYKLKSTFPSVKFRIIVSYSVVNMPGDEREIIHDCVVRFHAVRDGENYLSENLEGYKMEAVGIIEI